MPDEPGLADERVRPQRRLLRHGAAVARGLGNGRGLLRRRADRHRQRPAPAAIVEHDITFASGLGSDTFEIPCGAYTCVTARDTLHTLRKTDLDDFGVSGTAFVADFTSSGDGDALVGGNLNDDFYIDILDFGVFVGQYLDTVGADTPCPPAGPHADLDGDGVVFTGDFSFFTPNFLKSHEANCCGAPLATFTRLGRGPSAVPAPVTRISVAQLRARGMENLIVADLNSDGWLDVLDIQAFASGVRP